MRDNLNECIFISAAILVLWDCDFSTTNSKMISEYPLGSFGSLAIRFHLESSFIFTHQIQ